MRSLLLMLAIFGPQFLFAQTTNQNSFRQLDDVLPTPNVYRTASGAPGHKYWQQEADYDMKIEIDDFNQRLYGYGTITYHNNSPDPLSYLWVQLDQNVRSLDSDSPVINTSSISDKMTAQEISRMTASFDGGFKIEAVTDESGKDLKYIINKTMMRVDLHYPIKAGEKFKFNIRWWYNINNTKEIRGRSGYEPFEEDGNNVYCIAQFYPRMCMYNDVYGWQNKQFLGRGEFTLTFGDFKVEITVPDDHLVASTGKLINEDKVLSEKQKSRLKEAMKSELHPVIIATKNEAEQRMKKKSKTKKSWIFQAENVRDFAFACSRRFIWDALGVKMSDDRTVVAQSMWTKEGDCLWSKYSTKAVAHTVKWFSHYTFDYPYPTAWSIDGNMGMEYPMICFNFGRCEDDNTYSQRMKYGHIGVIIHEVGHNWFPMIVNSDERQWTWMDEGLTTFVQYLTEQQWERDYPSRRGPANKIVDYMKGDKEKISPIMTNSESIHQFGNNAYGKPATALNILRETIMGRELFDYAFKEYANRWKFKHPTPSDFFRTIEDASAVDLDWFWRSWFYTNNHVDMAISDVAYFKVDTKNPAFESNRKIARRKAERENVSAIRNREEIKQTQNEIDPSINDFYTNYDPLKTDAIDQEEYNNYIKKLTKEERELLKQNNNYYQITIDKLGGIAMPVILEFEYADGSKEIKRIPAEIWRFDDTSITKSFVTENEIVSITLDPYLETADIDVSNNSFPPQLEDDRFEIFKRRQFAQRGRSGGGENPMQRAARAQEKEKSDKERINKP